MEKQQYRFTQDCTFDDPKLGSRVHYKSGDVEAFYPKQVKYLRHAVELVAAPATSTPVKKKTKVEG